jgi:AcrR family transcriptional regulator
MARVAQAAATDRREQIVAVATRLFSERGYAGTSLDDVAAEIGFTKPAIYYWFESKADILFAIHDRIVGEAMARVRVIRRSGGPARQQLRAVLTQHVETLLANVEANTVFDRERHVLSAAGRRSIRRRDREYERALRDIYAAGIAEGTLRDIDPGLAVGALLGAINWTYRWSRVRSGTGAAEVADSLVDLIEHGVLTEAH